jgi:hypothetical protein
MAARSAAFSPHLARLHDATIPTTTGRVLAIEGLHFLADGEVLVGDGAAGDLLWRSQLSQLSECLSLDPAWVSAETAEAAFGAMA